MSFKLLAVTMCLLFLQANAMNRKVDRQLTYPQFPLYQEIDEESLLESLQEDLNFFGLSEEQKEQMRKADLTYTQKNPKIISLKDRLKSLKQETAQLESYTLSEKIAFANRVTSLIDESKKTNRRIHQQTAKLRKSIIATFRASPSEARRLTPKKYRSKEDKN